MTAQSPLLLGIDVGSTAIKTIARRGAEIVWSDYRRHESRPGERLLDVLREVEAAVGAAPGALPRVHVRLGRRRPGGPRRRAARAGGRRLVAGGAGAASRRPGGVAKATASRDAASRPSLPLARYAGRYRDPWYGEVTIAEEGGRLALTMTRTPGMAADLEHWQHDTFVARWRQVFMSDEAPADAYVSFALRPDATIERATMAPVSPAIDFSFDFQDLLLTPVPADVNSAKAP